MLPIGYGTLPDLDGSILEPVGSIPDPYRQCSKAIGSVPNLGRVKVLERNAVRAG